MAGQERLWNPAYLLLAVSNFFSWLSYNMVAPVITGYLQTLGASVFVCGIAGGLFAFTSCLSRPFSGMMSDRMNRKMLMCGFTMLMAVSLLLYSLVPSIFVILFFRGIHGIAFGISSTASLVLVSESVPEARLGEAVSYYGVMSVASMAVGPGIGIWLSEMLGYQYCLLISTVVLFVAGIATVLFPYEYTQKEPSHSHPCGTGGLRPAMYDQRASRTAVPDRGKREKRRLSLRQFVEPKLIGLAGVNAAFTMMNGVVSAFLVVFAAQQGIAGVSWHFTLNAAVLVISRIVLAQYMNRWSLKQNLYPAFMCGIFALLLIGRADTLTMLLIAAVVKAFAQGMSQPAIQTEGLRMVKPERRGVASGTIYIGGDLGQAVGPMLGGAAAQRVGYGMMYWICAVPLAAAWVYFFMREKRAGNRRDRTG